MRKTKRKEVTLLVQMLLSIVCKFTALVDRCRRCRL
jgi:hypothetical protein